LPKPPRILFIIIGLSLIGLLLVVDEILTSTPLAKEGWAALGSVITALAMLGTRLIDRDD